jgi:type IV fimbrial biogenesis protein FimT
MKKNSGYTMIEILIVAAIATIVMAIGIPSMRDFIKNDRLSTQINTLVGHLAYARSEAVLRLKPVIVCASNDQASCTLTDWADGWIVFADVDSSGGFSAGDELLRVKQPLEGGNTMVSSAGAVITYDNRGFAAPGSTGSFSLCDDRGATHIKAITISNTGRVRKGGSSSCT